MSQLVWEALEITFRTCANIGAIVLFFTHTPFWVVALIWLVLILYGKFIDHLGMEETQ
jgi:hypothetical protein